MTVIADTTLVICTRDRRGELDETVKTVLSGDRLPAELLVIDQSRDRHQQLADEPRVNGCQIRYRQTAPLGLSAGRNAGIEHASGRLVAFTDDDVWVPSGWFDELVTPLIDGDERTVITGPLLPTQPLAPGGFQLAIRTSMREAVYAKPGRRDVLVAANMAANRTTFQMVGPFDVRLGPGTSYSGGGEDNEFCLRLLRAGCQIRYRPEAAIYHRAWRPGSDYLRMRWRYGLGQGGFYGKLLAEHDRYGFNRLIRHLGYYGIRFPWRIVTQRRRAIGDVVFVGGLLTGIRRWLVSERSGESR
jgi:glycosyltransferase involved in cell wall biosynthesis